MIRRIAHYLIRKVERRVGVTLDYVHAIAETNIGLLSRYNRIFGIVDPRKHLPTDAYHAARLRGALAADCGTCVEAEINLALAAGLSQDWMHRVLTDQEKGDLNAVIVLTDAVVRDRIDAPDAREQVRSAYGDAGLIELSLAMNGAAFLPGVKRAMGYATACNLEVMQQLK